MHGTRKAYKDGAGTVYLDCTKCRKKLPSNDFYNTRKGFFGKHNMCKECSKSKRHEHYKNNKEKVLEKSRQYYQENREFYREWSQEYYKRNKDTFSENGKKWYENNKERVKENVRRWYECNREYKAQVVRQWVKANPDRKRLSGQLRRARKLLLPDTLTYEQTLLLGDTCVLTGADLTHLDHVIPVSIGHGGTTYENMIPLSAELNLSKNASNVFEWAHFNYERLGFTLERFYEVMTEVADRNDMTLEEYRDYVYWCHANPRNIELEEVTV